MPPGTRARSITATAWNAGSAARYCHVGLTSEREARVVTFDGVGTAVDIQFAFSIAMASNLA